MSFMSAVIPAIPKAMAIMARAARVSPISSNGFFMVSIRLSLSDS